MNIKVSSLKSSLSYGESFSSITSSFLKEIEDRIKTELVRTPLEDYNCDLKLIYIESGGSEGLFLNNFTSLKEPYYLLTNGSNNSLAASLEIMTYLKLHNLKGEVIHGDIDYVSSRILELVREKLC